MTRRMPAEELGTFGRWLRDRLIPLFIPLVARELDLHEIGDRIYRISSPVLVARGPSPSTTTSWSTMNRFSFPQG
jgi:hypothetical protein